MVANFYYFKLKVGFKSTFLNMKVILFFFKVDVLNTVYLILGIQYASSRYLVKPIINFFLETLSYVDLISQGRTSVSSA